MTKTILGVRIDDVTKENALQIVESWLSEDPPQKPGNSPRLVFTPGPEFLVTAHDDPEFKKILNAADLNIPDGFGLRLLNNFKNTVHGVDFMLALCQLAAEKKLTIGLLGGAAGVAQKTAEKLIKLHPNLKVAIAKDGLNADKIVANPDALPYSDILFVALGHPKQERLLHSVRNDNKFRVGMGVGGSFDFISGHVSEPSEIYSRLGLKWLGRLISRPKYMFPKVWKAVILYPWLSLSRTLKLTDG